MHHDRCITVSTAVGILALVAATAADAQVPSAMLREGDALPAAGAGHTVASISESAVNGVGGYAATVNSSDGVTTLSHAWGHATGGAGGLLFSEGTYGSYLQTSWESFFGIDDLGQVAYSPLANDLVGGATGLDGAWLNATVLANEGDPIPSLPGKVYRFNSRPGVTNNGMGYWVAGINDAVSAANEGNGLFNATAGVVLKTGDVIGGVGTLDANAADFNVRYSAQGTNYIIAVDTTGTTTTDIFLLVNGAATTPKGLIVREGSPVGPANGGLALENWSAFDFMNVTEAGNYMFTGDTGAATSVDEFIVYDGNVVYREGQSIGGVTFAGSIDLAYMNESGDITCIWDGNDGTGAVESLFLNGKRLLKLTDPVDLTGDGIVEATSKLSDFTGLASISIGPTRKIYFTADVDVNGTSTLTDDIEGFFVIEDPCGSVRRHGSGCSGTNGLRPDLQLNGCSQVGGSVSLEIRNGEAGGLAVLLFGLGAGETALGLTSCHLNISSPLVPALNIPLDGSGASVIPASIPSLPSVPVSFHMQAFTSDAGAPLGYVVSNALDVTIN